MTPEPPMNLLSRLQDAPVGTRELDYAIKEWLEPRDDYWSNRVAADWSTSLDAALALAERVLSGLGAWDVGYAYNAEPPHYARLVVVRNGDPEIFGRAHTPALALCAAIIAAKEGEK